MKLTRTLSAAVLAGTLLVSTTACFNKQEASHTVPSSDIGVSASATPSASPSASAIEAPVVEEADTVSPEETEEPVVEEETEPAPVEEEPKGDVTKEVPAILDTVNGFYDFTEKEDSLDRLLDVGQAIQKESITDAEAKALVAAVPEAFKYFDTSTPENVRQAYNELAATSMGVKTGGAVVTFNVSVEAVKYSGGDTASVDKNSVEVSVGGEVQAPIPGESNQLNLVQKDGKWLITI